jgi:hypothetical protein
MGSGALAPARISVALLSVLVLNLKQRLREWTPPPSSNRPTQLGPIDRASPYLRSFKQK